MKKILLLTVAFITFAASGVFTHFYHRSDNLSLRYNLWKHGLHPMPSDVVWSINADPNRSDLIRGKTKEEIKSLFPDFHEQPVTESQTRYVKWDIKGREHLWFGETDLIIFLENGTGEEMYYMKG
jgi:hypothetical protein